MGKNNQSKDEVPKPSSVPNREIFQRLGFLYQASTYLKSIEASTLPTDADSGRRQHRVGLGNVASSYIRNMRTIGSRAVTRMDPSIKRSICKKCHTVLLPGQTLTVRIKGSKIVYGCMTCGSTRAIPAPSVDFTSANDSTNDNRVGKEVSSTSIKLRKKRHKFSNLPLSARPDAGHVVFKGTDMILQNNESS